MDRTVRSGDMKITLDIQKKRAIEYSHSAIKDPLSANLALSLIFNDFATKNAFLRRMNIITVFYNYLGATSYPLTMESFANAGLSKHTNADTTRFKCWQNHTRIEQPSSVRDFLNNRYPLPKFIDEFKPLYKKMHESNNDLNHLHYANTFHGVILTASITQEGRTFWR
jgi:hypothetical protein